MTESDAELTGTSIARVLIAYLVVCVFGVTVVASLNPSEAADRRAINIWSDGTRMSGDLWLPDGFSTTGATPAIVLTHGWGGLRDHLNQAYAPRFVEAGFVVLTFDYRGWSDSDSRLVIIGDQPNPDGNGEIMVRARAIREVVDPVDQVRDILSALDFLSGEPGVDHDRIGLWGTSYSGGHVITVGARDKRVKAIVSQVSYQGVSPISDGGALARKRAIEKARGDGDPIPQGIDMLPNLRGTPDFAKMMGHSPLEQAPLIRVPTLVIDVESEELFDRTKNGLAVYEIIAENVTAEYKLYPGRHYDIYRQHQPAAAALALEWFQTHLMHR